MVLLNEQASLGYENTVPVIMGSDFTHPIGECTIVHNKQTGEYFGDVVLNDDADGDLYVYYISSHNDFVSFWFTGLQLFDHIIREERRTIQLKDMIV